MTITIANRTCRVVGQQEQLDAFIYDTVFRGLDPWDAARNTGVEFEWQN